MLFSFDAEEGSVDETSVEESLFRGAIVFVVVVVVVVVVVFFLFQVAVTLIGDLRER